MNWAVWMLNSLLTALALIYNYSFNIWQTAPCSACSSSIFPCGIIFGTILYYDFRTNCFESLGLHFVAVGPILVLSATVITFVHCYEQGEHEGSYICIMAALLQKNKCWRVFHKKIWSTIIQFTMIFRLWDESVIQEHCLETGLWILGPKLWPKSQNPSYIILSFITAGLHLLLSVLK